MVAPSSKNVAVHHVWMIHSANVCPPSSLDPKHTVPATHDSLTGAQVKPFVRVPRPIPGLVSKRAMVMEYVAQGQTAGRPGS